MHHNDFLSFYAPRPRLAPDAVPDPYLEIAKAGGRPGAVIEYPWSSFAGLRTPYLYQEVHGRRVQVSGPQRLLFVPVLALANVGARPGGLLRERRRFLVVHLHSPARKTVSSSAEEERLGEREMRPDLRRTLRTQAEAMVQALTGLWGAPTWSSPGLRVWDLELACRRGWGCVSRATARVSSPPGPGSRPPRLGLRGAATDDIYVTYRYAWNLAHGLGFTFNPGERVFGLTDPGVGLLLALSTG